MKLFMKFVTARPRAVIALLLLITGLMFPGLKRLKMEPSTEALMPKSVDEYRYNTRMKKVFGDSKLFLLSLIEEDESPLFSHDSFVLINDVVEEIEEFREFDLAGENARLEAVLQAGSISWDKTKEQDESSETTQLISEDEIDALLTEDAKITDEYFDVFAIDKPLPDDIYIKPIREKRSYQFESYSPVHLSTLQDSLDKAGNRQLDTILIRTHLESVDSNYQFSAKEYAAIVEEFETAYLYKSMEAVKSFMNPISGEDIVGTDDSLVPVDFIEEDDEGVRHLPASAEEFAAYKEKLAANPVFENNVYSADASGTIEALAMNIQFQVIEDPDFVSRYIIDIFMKHNQGALLFTPVGVPVFEKYIQDYMRRDMRKFLPFVLLVVIITFLLNFKMARGVVLPTVAIILSIIWTMGLMGHLHIPITMVVNILPTILVAVGSSYSIHVFNQYLHDQGMIAELGKRKGLVESMAHISATVLLAALTTFIGFSTLGFNQVVSLKHFGIFSAIGTLFAMLIASTLIPAVLSLTSLPKRRQDEKGAERNTLLQNLLMSTGRVTLANPLTVIVGSLLILIVSAFGITKLKVESSPVSQFKEDSYVVKADAKVSQALKGSLAINLLIDTGKEGGVKEPEFLRKLDELGEWTSTGENRSTYNLLVSYTFADTIKRMHKAMNSENDEFYSLPNDRATVEDYLMLYSGDDRNSDGLVDTLERFVDPHYRVANVFIKTGTYNGEDYSTGRLLRGVNALKAHMASDPYFSQFKTTVAGQTINYAVLNRLIAEGQVLTIILTLIIIAGIIFLLFRDFKASLVSLIPISCSIIVVFGTMGFFNIPLDIAKSIIAAITIGIGIDDTIHMLKTVRSNVKEGMPLKKAILASYKEAGIAIVYTSLALIFGFAVLMISEFKILFYLGWLVAMNMLTTTVAALVVLPAAIWLFKVRFNIEADDEDEDLVKNQKRLISKPNISFEGE